jgi:hypothetical protein
VNKELEMMGQAVVVAFLTAISLQGQKSHEKPQPQQGYFMPWLTAS